MDAFHIRYLKNIALLIENILREGTHYSFEMTEVNKYKSPFPKTKIINVKDYSEINTNNLKFGNDKIV